MKQKQEQLRTSGLQASWVSLLLGHKMQNLQLYHHKLTTLMSKLEHIYLRTKLIVQVDSLTIIVTMAMVIT